MINLEKEGIREPLRINLKTIMEKNDEKNDQPYLNITRNLMTAYLGISGGRKEL